MFQIDFWELLFLAEICIPPVPIARAMFWDKLSDVHYDLLTCEERKKIFGFIIKNPKFNKEQADCLHFYNRFNPDNQFEVTIKYKRKIQKFNTYLHEDKYHISKTTSIEPQYIIAVNKITNNKI